jgi:hypothetical protein
MNLTRLALAAVAATVVDGVYGFAVYGNALAGQFGAFPAVFRSTATQSAYIPGMLAGILIAMLAVTYLYAKSYEGGGLAEGLRFGVLMAVFHAGYFVATDYAILNIGRRLAAGMAVAGFGEWLIVGGAIGLMYRGAAAPGV